MTSCIAKVKHCLVVQRYSIVKSCIAKVKLSFVLCRNAKVTHGVAVRCLV